MEILEKASKMSKDIHKDIFSKYTGKVFLPEITKANPHLHNEVNALLDSYCELLIDLDHVIMIHDSCKQSAELKMSAVTVKLKASRKQENTLFWKAFNLDIGGDH